MSAPVPQSPMGLGAPPPPAMVPNPAYAQWAQTAQAWLAEKQQRQQQFMAACQLISSDAIQRFKIDIETDSTVAADEQEEKRSRTEFLQAVTPFMEAMVPIAQQNPPFAPLIKELIMFGVRGFPSSRSLEESFETALDKMVSTAGQNPPQPGGKGNTKSPMEIQADAAEAQGKQQVQQQQNMVKLVQTQAEMQLEREKLAQQQMTEHADLMLRGREMEGREALDAARLTHLASRDTRGLV